MQYAYYMDCNTKDLVLLSGLQWDHNIVFCPGHVNDCLLIRVLVLAMYMIAY